MFGGGDRESATATSQETPPELTLAIRVPKADNAIWESFESFDVRLDSLTLAAADGTTADLAVAGASDYRDEAKVDGDDAVYKLRPQPATYESGTVTLEVRDYAVQKGEPDLPFEGFENATLDCRGKTFEPASGEESTFTLVVVVRKEADAYVLDPALEW